MFFSSDTARRNGFLMLLMSYGGVSIKPVISKYLLSGGWTPISLYAFLLFMTVIILGVHELASLPQKKSWKLSKRDWKGLLISTLTGGFLAPLLTFTALKSVTATHAVLVGSISPIFVVALAIILLGERLSRNALLGIVLLLLGLGTLLYREIVTFHIDTATLLLIASAIIGPFSVIAHKKFVEHRHLDSIVLIRCTISLFLVGGWMLLTEPESFQLFMSDQNLLLVLTLSVVGFILPYLLYYNALKIIKTFEAGIVSLFSPVFTILLASALLGETLQKHELVSLIIMMVGIILINVPLTKWRIVPSRLLMMGPLRK